MSKKFKSLLLNIAIIGTGLFIIFSSFLPTTNNVEYATGIPNVVYEQIKEEEYARADIDMNKKLLEDKINNAKLFVGDISNDVEYILSTITCNTTISHDSSPDKNWNDWLIDSSIDVSLDCEVTLSIPASKVDFAVDKNGMVNVIYDKNDIQVKSVNVNSYNAIENKNLLGHEYTKSELLSLIEVAQDNVRNEINNNQEHIYKASTNLNNYIIRTANKFNVCAVNFNNEYTQQVNSFKYVKKDNVKYGHGNRPLDLKNVKYIVIHDTQNFHKTADAEMHYNYLNTNKNAYGAHVYVDSHGAIQVMDFNKQMYAVGNNPNMNNQVINNSNSISIEICLNNYGNKELMNKTLENTTRVIEMLKQSLPNDVKIVRHSDANLKPCPKIFDKNESCYVMDWEEFVNKL